LLLPLQKRSQQQLEGHQWWPLTPHLLTLWAAVQGCWQQYLGNRQQQQQQHSRGSSFKLLQEAFSRQEACPALHL
jgi:hypothetical protein